MGAVLRVQLTHLPGAREKIVFGKFHLVAYLNKAVDETRRKTLRQASADTGELRGTKYLWQRSQANSNREQRQTRSSLSRQFKALGRAWSIKESFTHFWSYHREAIARTFFARWYGWAVRSRVPAMVEVAKMFKRHFENIITWVDL